MMSQSTTATRLGYSQADTMAGARSYIAGRTTVHLATQQEKQLSSQHLSNTESAEWLRG
ncbi:hypothetical protein LMG24235_06585 [Paraburkholderia sabiae]|nr:hypothetical protein LMG24235_06585 [Paraburkholderia sabiae]